MVADTTSTSNHALSQVEDDGLLPNAHGFTSDTAQPLTTFVLKAETELSQEPVHVISLIPGIRDIGIWTNNLDFYSKANGLHIAAFQVDLGRVSTLCFLLRIGARKREREALIQLLRARILYPTAKHSILAHSYGTEMLGRIIHRIPLSYISIFTCGAVVPSKFAEQLANNTKILINDCSSKDKWPVAAESLNPYAYQATGTHGMRAGAAWNRFFHTYRHGSYLTTEHFEQHIIPILFRRAEVSPDKPRYSWTAHLPTYLHRIILGAIFTVLAWEIWRSFGPYLTSAAPVRLLSRSLVWL